jgi:integrase
VRQRGTRQLAAPSRARRAEVPAKVVSERLGHSNVAFTMSVYQHVLPGMRADAAKAFSEAVFRD